MTNRRTARARALDEPARDTMPAPFSISRPKSLQLSLAESPACHAGSREVYVGELELALIA